MMGMPAGHGIVAMSAPGMAPRNTFHAKPDAFNDSPFFDGFDRIVRTAWRMAARCPEQRRKGPLVDANGQNEEFL